MNRLPLLTLMLLMILPLAACSATGVSTRELVDWQSYAIVRPEFPENDEGAAAGALWQAVQEKTGVTLSITDDYVQRGGSVPEDGLEILIGDTNRAASSGDILRLEEYTVGMEGQSLVIRGGSSAALRAAVDWYIENCVGEGLSCPKRTFTGSLEGVFTMEESALTALRAETDGRIEAIRSTGNMEIPADAVVYYVSPDGRDEADGRSPETAWKTIDRVNAADLNAGDYVCFERGGLWRDVQLRCRPGVTYTAYGEGEKPAFYGSPEDGADPSCWTLAHEADGVKIWVYRREMADVGAVIFNGEIFSSKALASRIDQQYVVRGDEETPFDWRTQLTENLMCWSDIPVGKSGYPNASTVGKLYLRCDEGNPGELYDSIEFNVRYMICEIGSDPDITIDNIRIMYTGGHGVHAWDETEKNNRRSVDGLTVTNCEFGWIGGSVQYYNTSTGAAVRFGNGVEIYGMCRDYTVENCYIWQCYDAGITNQMSLTSRNPGTEAMDMVNVVYRGNVIENCCYSIEYWLSGCEITNPSCIRGMVVEDNLMWYAGVGLSETRPNKGAATHMKGGFTSVSNRAVDFVVRNNLFAYSKDVLLFIRSGLMNEQGGDSLPLFEGNRLVAAEGDTFGVFAYTETIPGVWMTIPPAQAYTPSLPAAMAAYGTNEYWFAQPMQ